MAREDTRRRMTALVQRWETSGETQEMFARRHGLSRAKFRYWRRQIEAQPGPAAIAFAPVQVRELIGAEASPVEVALVTGERVIIRAGASADLVRVVLSALRSPC